jgi:hypothetical protein
VGVRVNSVRLTVKGTEDEELICDIPDSDMIEDDGPVYR